MSDQLQMTDGMHIIVEALKQNNIDTIYGVVGIPVTDMARHAQAEGIRYIGFRHEQSAGYAAAASGFLTQKPGICLTVSAPGFLNGLTALANATVNGFPMIMISGSSDRAIVDLQQGDYEELDQMNAAKPYAKAAFRVNQPQDLGIALARAIRVSVSGRPGGVYLDLPANVLAATMEKDEALTTIVKVENPSPALLPCPKSVTSAISLLAKAERPLVILGKGATYSQADEQLREFIESAQIPFLPMSMAKGILEDTHPLSAAKEPVVWAPVLATILVLVGVKIPAAWDPTFNLIAKANSRVAVFAAGLTLAAHKFEFSAEIAYNTFLKLILMPLALLLVGMACHLNSEHLQMMVLAGALPPAFSGIIIASRFNVYTRTGTASLAVSVLGFVVTAPLWIYVSRLVS